MALKLNPQAIERAQYIIKAGEIDHTGVDFLPTQDDIAKFLETHTMEEYGQWFLAIDTEAPENIKDRYLYPYGDFNIVHKQALEHIAKEAPAEIAQAAQQLISLIDANESDLS